GSRGRVPMQWWTGDRPGVWRAAEPDGRRSMIILETERLLFRDHEEVDLDPFCEMMADPEFRRLSGGGPLPREEAEKSFRSIVIGQEAWLRPKPMGLLATVFKPEGRYIGRCGLYPHRGDDNGVIPGEGTLAYYLARH